MKLSYLMSVLPISAIVCACSTSSLPITTIESVNSNSVIVESKDPANLVESPVMVGGWVPVFFSGYNQNQVNDIVNGLNQGRIKKAVVSYPTRMQTLALKIHDNIQKNTTVKIPMESVELRDTDQVKYDLKQVIVTLYFN